MTLAKFTPSKIKSIIFPIKNIAIAEYSPISMFLKNITFNAIIIVSNVKIKLLLLYCFLYALIICDNKSEPPVDASNFNIIAVPIPAKTPPYMHPRNLSCVNGVILSIKSIISANTIVPYIDLTNSCFPTLKYAITNSGMFNTKTVTPIGTLKK